MTIKVRNQFYAAEQVAAFDAERQAAIGRKAWYSLRGSRGGHYTLVEMVDGTFEVHQGVFKKRLDVLLPTEVTFLEAA